MFGSVDDVDDEVGERTGTNEGVHDTLRFTGEAFAEARGVALGEKQWLAHVIERAFDLMLERCGHGSMLIRHLQQQQ